MSDKSNAFKAHLLFSFLLSGSMSLLVSCISTGKAIGVSDVVGAPADFVSVWLPAWLTSWLVAFPAVMLVAPVVRRVVNKVFAVDQ